MRKESQRGQALLIVVLIMVIALTIGLSVASRTVINLKLASDEESSQKAFFAAEAGVEQALKTNQPVTIAQSLGNNSQIGQVSIQSVTGNSVLFNNGLTIPKDDGIELWLTNYSPTPTNLYTPPYWNGNVTFYWGTSVGSCTDAALEILIITSSKTSPSLTRYAYDPCIGRRSGNNFTAAGAGGSINGKNFPYATSSISITNGVYARVVPLYAGTQIGAVAGSGSSNFPPQGQVITALGSAGSTKRKISYFQGYESLPSEFFYSLFSPK